MSYLKLQYFGNVFPPETKRLRIVGGHGLVDAEGRRGSAGLLASGGRAIRQSRPRLAARTGRKISGNQIFNLRSGFWTG